MSKVIQLNFPPKVALEYARAAVENGKVQKMDDSQRKIIEDIATLVGVACDNLEPTPTPAASGGKKS